MTFAKPDLSRPQFRDPEVAHHREQPAVEPRSVLPLIDATDRAFTNGLDQIVRIRSTLRQCPGESAQTRQKRNQIAPEALQVSRQSATPCQKILDQ